MRNVRNTYTGLLGIVVGQRKDGSVAILFENDELEWFDAITFNGYYEVV